MRSRRMAQAVGIVLALGLAGCGGAPLGTGLLSGVVPEGWSEEIPGKDYLFRLHDATGERVLWIEGRLLAGNGASGGVTDEWKAIGEEKRGAALGAADPKTYRTVRIYRRRIKLPQPGGKTTQKLVDAVADIEVDRALVETFLGGLVLTDS